ncbi:bacterial group 2 Ig-like protein [Clostridiales bacterium oral taxon 876 str. F0540]|nr:bacterial group 2 Ig-like protein [Clostridiales bacterium oral taxon 876 str. F0540]
MKNKRFKKINIVILSLLLVVLQFSGVSYEKNIRVNAEETLSYQWNNTIPEKKPAAGAKNNGKLVLFDNSHQNTAGQADWVLDGGFSDFADTLVKEGYTVREYRGIDKNKDGAIRFFDDRNLKSEEEGTAADKNEAIITYDAIKDADVFVTAEANRPLRISEREALKKFVDSGKGIYFIGDHYNADRNCNTWDGTEVYNGYNRYDGNQYNIGGVYGDMRNPKDASKGWLSENFGLRFRFNAIDFKSGATGVKPESETEGLTKGVAPVLMAASSTLAITNPSIAKGIVYLSNTDKAVKWGSAVDKGVYFGGENEGAYVAISKPSAGRAAFIGDSSPIEDATAKYKNEKDGSTKSLHAGWTSAGNAAQLSVNIINWLADSSINYIGFDGSSHSKGIATAVPMAAEEMSDPDKGSPWSSPSIDSWNTDSYAAGSYGAPFGTTTSGGGTNPPPASGSPILTLAPIYIYGSEPFAVAIGGTVINPEFGIYYRTGGTQVGAVRQNGVWSSGNSYAKVEGNPPITLTVKATKIPSDGQMGIRVRVPGDSKKSDTLYVTSMASGYGFIEGMLSAEEGEVAVVSDGEDIIGSAQVEADKKVKIAVKEGINYTISIFDKKGQKKADLPGNYKVTAGQSTNIVQEIKATGISLDKTEVKAAVGTEFQLIATVTPENASNKKVHWTTSNQDVATVTNGLVTLKNAGSAVITAATEDGGYTAECKVTAYVPVTGVQLNKNSLFLKQNESETLIAKVLPENAENKGVKFTSSNTDVAEVDINGKITAKSVGTAIITATTEEGGYKAEASVTVEAVPVEKVAVKSVKLNKHSLIITSKQTTKLIANINPENATNKNLIWTIDDQNLADIASKDNTLVISAKKFGIATVTVKTEDGGFTDSCRIIILPSLK